MDVVGYSTAPGKSSGAADILAGAAVAYAAGATVAVLAAQQLQVVCTLHGSHRAQVTAIKWCPAHHSRDFKEASQLRLASGDSVGGVVVWDILTARPVARLEDSSVARDLLKDYANKTSNLDDTSVPGSPVSNTGYSSMGNGVTSMTWVLPGFKMLAVMVSPALLLLWDVTSGSIVWHRELSSSGSEIFRHMSTAPFDSRQLCVCGHSGALLVLQLTDPARDKVQVQQYRVNLPDSSTSKNSASGGSNSSLQALFPSAPGLLVLLLPRELVVFALELGQPAASSPLPPGLPVLSHLLGVYGKGFCQGVGDQGGLDFAYCVHVDGSLSVWIRTPGELRFKVGSITKLIPSPVKGAGAQVMLSAACACLVQQQQQHKVVQTAATTAAVTQQLTTTLAGMHLTREGAAAGTTAGARKSEVNHSKGPPTKAASALSGSSLLILGVTSDGRQWQWQVPVPQYPKRSFLTSSNTQPVTAINASIQAARASAVPEAVAPQLTALLHGLPGTVTATAWQPCPILTANQLSKVNYSASAAVTPSKQVTVAGASSVALVAGQAAQAAGHDTCSWRQSADRNSNDDTASSLPGPQTQHTALASANCIALGVAATSTGHVEVICCRRGVINPISVELHMSHAVHKDVVRSVRWLGSTSRVVTFSSERISNGAWRNSLVLTDVRTGRSVPFRDKIGSEGSPMSGIRISPSGTYILLLLKGAPCELWTTAPKDNLAPVSLAAAAAGAAAVASADSCAAAAASPAVHDMGGEAKPWRVRLLDLPFSAVEWVAADDGPSKDVVTLWAATDDFVGSEADDGFAGGGHVVEPSMLQTPPERQSTGSTHHTRSFSRILSALTSPSMSAAGDGVLESSMPTEMLAFGLNDGRSGVLSVRGRKVTDMRPKRPLSSPAPGDSVASALAGAWPLLVLGDADGTLLAWDLTTGRCNALATGYGVIRRIQLAPACSSLVPGALDPLPSGTPATGSERLRLAVLFTGGHFGVYDLDAAGRVRQTAANPAACGRVGKALDISWVCMPRPVGAGAILSVVLEDGSICLLDVAQSPIARPKQRQRHLLLQQLLGTSSPAYCNWAPPGSCCSSAVCVGRADVVLMPPRPLGSSVLLPQPYVMLLRYILQAGIRQDLLLYLSSACTDDDEDIQHELLMTLPRAARAALSHIAAQAQQQHQSGPGQQLQQQVPGVSKAQSSPLLLQGSTSSGIVVLGMQSSSSKMLAGMQESSERPADETAAEGLGSAFGSQPFDGDLGKLLRVVASMCGSGLLSNEEWRWYSEALKSGLVARRMAVAAHVSGHQDEARFWSALPATLASVKALQTAILQHQESIATTPRAGETTTAAAGTEPAATITTARSGTIADDSDVDVVSDYDRLVQQAVEGKSAAAVLPSSTALASVSTSTAASAGSSPISPAITRRGSGSAVPGHVRCTTGPEQLMSEGLGAIRIAAAGRAVRLWDEELVLSAAQEKLLWHEALPGQVFDSEGMLERRLLEYVVLGDYATAVAFLLSTPPESSVSYYRSVVCALALAASASLHAQSAGNNTSMQASATLHLQAAKVVSAHAASIGDNLLGVPLNCSAGLNADAVTVLQEAGRWQSAAVLIARALTGTERAQALSRWSSHVLHHEGGVWQCAGLLTAAGCLSAALQVLRDAGLPDCAHAYVQACQEAGLLVKPAVGVQQQMPQQQAQQQQDFFEPAMQLSVRFSSDAGDKAADELFQDQGSNSAGMELFDLLGQRTRMLGNKNRSDKSLQQYNGTAALGADGELITGPEEIRTVTSEYASYLCALISSL